MLYCIDFSGSNKPYGFSRYATLAKQRVTAFKTHTILLYYSYKNAHNVYVLILYIFIDFYLFIRRYIDAFI